MLDFRSDDRFPVKTGSCATEMLACACQIFSTLLKLHRFFTSIKRSFEVQKRQTVNMIFKMRFFDILMTSYLKILKSPKNYYTFWVYLVRKDTFLTSFGLWEDFRFLELSNLRRPYILY